MATGKKKARGDAVLKTLGDGLQEELYQYLRRHTQEATLLWLKEKQGIASSPRALSEFWEWYPRSFVLRAAARTSDQLEATLKKIPQLRITADQAKQVAQVNFEIQAAQDRDPVLFAALRRGELERERLLLEREKFEHAKKSDVEKGLDALFEEIREIPAAVKLFEQMKALVAEAKGA